MDSPSPKHLSFCDSPFPADCLPRLNSRGNGEIQLILGPMFSGKTSELLRRIRRYKIAKYRCLILKYAKDTRYSVTEAATHDLMTCQAVPCASLSEINKINLSQYDVIGIDEGQFFSDIVSFAESCANAGQVVVVAALDGTFQRHAFGKVLELVPLSESIMKLSAVCMQCYSDAAFTMRLGNETEVEVIGGSEKYIAVCRACYSSLQQQQETNDSNKTITKKVTESQIISNYFDDEPDGIVKIIQCSKDPEIMKMSQLSSSTVGFSTGRGL